MIGLSDSNWDQRKVRGRHPKIGDASTMGIKQRGKEIMRRLNMIGLRGYGLTSTNRCQMPIPSAVCSLQLTNASTMGIKQKGKEIM
jgi:hypothetical protein